VVIYPEPSVESEYTQNFQELLQPPRVHRIYLNQLESKPDSWGINTLKLIIADTEAALEMAQPLIERVRQQVQEEKIRKDLLGLIESILIYKLPKASRKEIEQMFSLSDLKQTRFYQDAKDEGLQQGLQQGKLNAIPRMLKLGLSIDIIAQSLDLPPETVQQEAQKYQQQ